MAEVLVVLIRKGKITLDDIKDDAMREKVREILEEGISHV